MTDAFSNEDSDSSDSSKVRNNLLHVRATDEEKSEWQDLAKFYGFKTLAKFMRTACNDYSQRKSTIDPSKMELARELQKIGVNLNEIATACNQIVRTSEQTINLEALNGAIQTIQAEINQLRAKNDSQSEYS
jgi:hypothetical protein